MNKTACELTPADTHILHFLCFVHYEAHHWVWRVRPLCWWNRQNHSFNEQMAVYRILDKTPIFVFIQSEYAIYFLSHKPGTVISWSSCKLCISADIFCIMVFCSSMHSCAALSLLRRIKKDFVSLTVKAEQKQAISQLYIWLWNIFQLGSQEMKMAGIVLMISFTWPHLELNRVVKENVSSLCF